MQLSPSEATSGKEPIPARHSRQNAVDYAFNLKRSKHLIKHTHHKPRSDNPQKKIHYRESSSGIIKGEFTYPTESQLIKQGIKSISNPYSWENKELLDGGIYGSVVFAQNGNHQIAIKLAPANTKAAIYLQREAAFLHKLRHNSIIALLGIARVNVQGRVEVDGQCECYSGDEFWLALRYKNGGSFWNIMVRNPNWLTELFLQIVTKRLVTAVVWAHSRGIVHRDIKPDNILFDSPSENCEHEKDALIWIAHSAVLADFGLASSTEEGELTQKTGNAFYMAPELLKPETFRYKPKQVDTWSIGATVFAGFFKKDPYRNIHPSEDQKNLTLLRIAPILKSWELIKCYPCFHVRRA